MINPQNCVILHGVQILWNNYYTVVISSFLESKELNLLTRFIRYQDLSVLIEFTDTKYMHKPCWYTRLKSYLKTSFSNLSPFPFRPEDKTLLIAVFLLNLQLSQEFINEILNTNSLCITSLSIFSIQSWTILVYRIIYFVLFTTILLFTTDMPNCFLEALS